MAAHTNGNNIAPDAVEHTPEDFAEYIRLLRRDHYYGEVNIRFQDGKITLMESRQTYKNVSEAVKERTK